jgi:RNA polymerase sigma-70 factor (ECF subfamily)
LQDADRDMTAATKRDDDAWLERFHAGDRAVLEDAYREHFALVHQAAGRVLDGANRETVVQEVFLRLLTSEPMRRTFRGGALGPWLKAVARNHAIDFRRRLARETEVDEIDRVRTSERMSERIEARILIDRFRKEVLPAKWLPVFEARFIQQLDQREAARSIGMSRTTLAYQELRIRSLLRTFLLEAEAP